MSHNREYVSQARALLALGLPLIGTSLAQMSLHVTDTVMMGWYGVAPLAALVLSGSYYFVLFVVGAGFGNAMMGQVSDALGRGDEAQVRRETRMGLWLSILFGVAVLPFFWWSEPILLALGQKPEVAALAQDFLRIAGFGLVPALVVNALKSYLAALERAGVVLWVTLAGVVLNTALAWALIFGNWGAPELGVRGAATASLTVQIVSALLLMLYAAREPASRRFHLFARFWRPDWPAFWRVYRQGWPIGLTGLAEVALFSGAALMMGWIGTVELAAHGIALQVAALGFMVHMGLSQAATVRVGRSYGEGDTDGLRGSAKVALVMSGLFGLAMVTLFLTFPGPIIGLYLDRADPDAPAILAYGIRLLALAALFQMFDAAQVMGLGLLRGVQDTRVPMWIAIFSYWIVGIPASYLLAFPLHLGGEGLWLGLVAGLAVAAVLLNLRFWRGLRGRLAAA